MNIRDAVLADVPALHQLIESAYRGDEARRGWSHEANLLDGQRTDLEALQAILADPKQRMLVAQAEALIACVALRDRGDGVAYLGMLTVSPARQAGGLGRIMLHEAEIAAKIDWNATRIEMTVIKQRGDLIAWYERRGYALTGERRPFPYGDERFGLPRRPDLEFVVLEKPLC